MQMASWFLSVEREASATVIYGFSFLDFLFIVGSFEGFKEVTNTIRKFILVEEETLMVDENKLSKVLMDMDVSKGLPKDVEIMWDGGTFVQ